MKVTSLAAVTTLAHYDITDWNDITDCQNLLCNTDSEVTAPAAVTTLAHYDITDCHSLQDSTDSEGSKSTGSNNSLLDKTPKVCNITVAVKQQTYEI